jgi:hypothetical protein
MAKAAARRDRPLTTRRTQPLIGIPFDDGVDEVVQYFSSEEEADQAMSAGQFGVEGALRLVGAWEHLDSEDGPDMLDELDRLRHESAPSPLLEL